ncbi:MAG: glycosyl transferase [Planctomycetota bacterium]|nr:MAG: glycosyl transferase [Planctomycetota bacterium]
MKILLLTHKLPFPLHDGYNLHNYHYVRELHERHEFHLVSVGHAEDLPDEIAALFQSVRVIPPPPKQQRSIPQRIVHLLDVDQVFDNDPAVFAAASEVVQREGIDVCWTSGAKMLVHSHRLGLPTLGDIADEAVKEAVADLKRARSPVRLAWALKNVLNTWRYQRKYLRHTGVCTVVSEFDRATLGRNCPRLAVRVVPNGVDADVFKPLDTPPEHPSVVFEGAMNFEPNVEGIVSFCADTLPLIRAELPELKVFIVGKNPTPEVQALGELPGVTVTGFVDDVRPWVDKASVFVCPLRRGAGIKNKILQAWAMQRPVVATPVSCGGLKLKDGVNIVVAEEPAAFAREVVSLLSDEARRVALGVAGRETVLEHYSWASRADAMEEILEQVCTEAAEKVAV